MAGADTLEQLSMTMGYFRLILRHFGDTAERRAAILAYEKAASLDSADALSQFCLGQVYEELEDWERATAYFKKSVELNPKFPLPQAGLKRIGSKMRD